MIPPLNTTSPFNPGTQTTQPVVPIRLLNESGRLLLEAVVLPEKLPPLKLEEHVTARIAERLASNRLAVLIKNGLFTLNFPPDVDTSEMDSLVLRVVSLKPSLTFTLVSATGLNAFADSSTEVLLSRASRYLLSLLQQTKVPSEEVSSLRLDITKHPSEQVAHQLKQSVEKSGLFYEAHLKEWLNGRVSLESIKDEVQARVGQTNLPALGQIVQQQLHTLETSQIILQGFLWPGQPVSMLIEQVNDEEESGAQDREAQGWATSLSITLPLLGGLEARIRVLANRVDVSFVAESKMLSEAIQQQRARLQEGLKSAGLELSTLVIKNEKSTSN